jgi:hypothetical protein
VPIFLFYLVSHEIHNTYDMLFSLIQYLIRFDPGYTQACFNSCSPNFSVLFKMEYRNIKRKLAEAPKYSTLTGKEPAVCHPVRLKHIGEDILYVHVRAVCSVNEV